MHVLEITHVAEHMAWTPVSEKEVGTSGIPTDLSADILTDVLQVPGRITKVSLSGCCIDCPGLIPTLDEVRLRVYTLNGGSITVEGTLSRDGIEHLGIVSAVFQLDARSPEWEALFESL